MSVVPGRCLLKQRLKIAKLTQTQLSDRTGIKIQKLSDYAHNRRQMSLATCKTIALALDCHMDDLYSWLTVPIETDRRRRRYKKE